MVSVGALIILVTSSLALCICLREIAHEWLRFSVQRNNKDWVRSLSREMRSLDFKMNGGGVSDAWIEKNLIELESDDSALVGRMDYLVWMIGLAIVSIGGVAASLSTF